MNYHKCKAMPQGTVIENIDTTYNPFYPLSPSQKTSEWRLMYSNYGFVNQIKVLYCPYCGQELEENP